MQMQHYDHFLKLLGYAICVCVYVCVSVSTTGKYLLLAAWELC